MFDAFTGHLIQDGLPFWRGALARFLPLLYVPPLHLSYQRALKASLIEAPLEGADEYQGDLSLLCSLPAQRCHACGCSPSNSEEIGQAAAHDQCVQEEKQKRTKWQSEQQLGRYDRITSHTYILVERGSNAIRLLVTPIYLVTVLMPDGPPPACFSPDATWTHALTALYHGFDPQPPLSHLDSLNPGDIRSAW
jgi:hypothetical protein